MPRDNDTDTHQFLAGIMQLNNIGYTFTYEYWGVMTEQINTDEWRDLIQTIRAERRMEPTRIRVSRDVWVHLHMNKARGVDIIGGVRFFGLPMIMDHDLPSGAVRLEYDLPVKIEDTHV